MHGNIFSCDTIQYEQTIHMDVLQEQATNVYMNTLATIFFLPAVTCVSAGTVLSEWAHFEYNSHGKVDCIWLNHVHVYVHTYVELPDTLRQGLFL